MAKLHKNTCPFRKENISTPASVRYFKLVNEIKLFEDVCDYFTQCRASCQKIKYGKFREQTLTTSNPKFPEKTQSKKPREKNKHTKKKLYFESSDPHHDISKQPRGCCDMSCWGKFQALAQVPLSCPTLMFDHKVICPSTQLTSSHLASLNQNHAKTYEACCVAGVCAESGHKHAKNMSVRLRAPPVKHF